MSKYTAELVELLAAKVNPMPHAVEGFPSLHPIMRIRRWFDRRLSKRKRVQLPATIYVHEELLQATVVDMSSTGAGLIGNLGLKAGDLAVVTVDMFEPINCEVVWASSSRAGVKFIQPS